MASRERDRKEIQELVQWAISEMGSAGCNDWIVENTEENRAWVDELYQYGVKNELIDADSGPNYYEKSIFWFDFIVAEIVTHRFFAENP